MSEKRYRVTVVREYEVILNAQDMSYAYCGALAFVRDNYGLDGSKPDRVQQITEINE